MPRIVIAPDKFRGTLEAADVASALATGLLAARPGLDVRCCPVADGGEGTLAAALANGWEPVTVPVAGPLGEPRTAAFGIGSVDGARAALVELADASGLAQIPSGPDGRPHAHGLLATSRGTGELIRAALDDRGPGVSVSVSGTGW